VGINNEAGVVLSKGGQGFLQEAGISACVCGGGAASISCDAHKASHRQPAGQASARASNSTQSLRCSQRNDAAPGGTVGVWKRRQLVSLYLGDKSSYVEGIESRTLGGQLVKNTAQ
jgi:hypothetical protein